MPKPKGKDPQRELFGDARDEDEQPAAEATADQADDADEQSDDGDA